MGCGLVMNKDEIQRLTSSKSKNRSCGLVMNKDEIQLIMMTCLMFCSCGLVMNKDEIQRQKGRYRIEVVVVW